MLKPFPFVLVVMLACTGPQGPEGPPGASGPTGATGVPGMDAVIADGSITREKLARESVLPEHRGRSNSVVSFTVLSPASPPGIPRSTGAIYTVPAGKNLVLTDLMFFSEDGNSVSYPIDLKMVGGSSRLRTFSSNVTLYAKISLEAGVRFTSGEAFEVVVSPSFQSPTAPMAPVSGFVAGYEY